MFRLNSDRQTISDLAIFNGEPTFNRPVVFGRPNIPDVESVLKDVRAVLDSGILSNDGPFVRQFEEEVCNETGARYCIATCNATVALEMVVKALELKGEVIVPSFTFIATAHAVAWQGLTPVFVDVDPTTHTIDPDCVKAAVTSSTTGICGVHLWGNVCDVKALQDIADQHGLKLWFDAAHAFSVTSKGMRVGGFGVAEVLSFHATKFINAFEGGAIVTNDADLARILREMRAFGIDDAGRVARLGTNAKMTEVSAVMGLHSLRQVNEITETNRRNFRAYRDFLQDCPGIVFRAPVDTDHSNCQYVVCEIDESQAGISRDEILTVIEAEGVLAKRYFYPGCHQADPYLEKHKRRNTPLPVTEKLAQTTMVLPTGLSVDNAQIEKICGMLAYVIENSTAIRSKLQNHQSPNDAR